LAPGRAPAAGGTAAPPHANQRIEALCDGVFAIAMTLLILDVRLPAGSVGSTSDFWRELQHLAPAIFAFVLSFVIILITWVNHHATMKLVSASSTSFVYANGFLLLSVVSLPFPTSLVGDFLWTDHAAPAVVLYTAVLAVQAVGWVLVTGAALNGHLAASEQAASTLRNNRNGGVYGAVFYTLLAVLALWVPLASAALTTASWIVWLVYSIRVGRG